MSEINYVSENGSMKSYCSIEGCSNLYYSFGLCRKHRLDVKKSGKIITDFQRAILRTKTDLSIKIPKRIGGKKLDHVCDVEMARFYSRIKISPSGCWEMSGRRINSGYSRIEIKGRRLLAHRFSYSFFVGQLKDGLVVCHSCDNKICCNPAHLFQATEKENMADAIRKGRLKKPALGKFKKFCKRGHLREHPNLLKRRGGYWACKECQYISARKLKK